MEVEWRAASLEEETAAQTREKDQLDALGSPPRGSSAPREMGDGPGYSL